MTSEAEKNLRWREEHFANGLAMANKQLMATELKLKKMKKINVYLLLVIGFMAIVLFSSCATQKRCEMKCPPKTTIKDSVVITYHDSIRVKDSVSVKVKDSIRYTAAVKDSGELSTSENGTYKFKNENVAIKIVVKDGKVKYFIDVSAIESRYNSKIESLTSELSVYKSKDSISTHSAEIIKPAPSEHVSWYLKLWHGVKDIFSWIGLLVVLLVVGRFLFKIVVKRLTL